MLNAVSDSLLSLFYPQNCHICKNSVENRANGVACEACWKNTHIFSDKDVICGKCCAFLPESKHTTEAYCRQCDEHVYDSVRAVGVYELALAASIVHLKTTPFAVEKLRFLLNKAFLASPFLNTDLIVPVPLSSKRLLERGFNQAGLIAGSLSKNTGIALDEYSLVRTIHTPMHRAAMDKKAREMTVKNAFEVKRPKLMAGRNILLIDDILTSGSTASHCAKALKKSGASKVNVLTLARAA
ncbi:MAG: double zinc ribbon domain-containing protein [Acidobacteriota bacterium]|jgi:ComF family protein|nr:double zinc ribbon domain-containing protein [Acidobacteriota bacterium]